MKAAIPSDEEALPGIMKSLHEHFKIVENYKYVSIVIANLYISLTIKIS